MLSSIGIFFIFHEFEPDTEKRHSVMVASIEIDEGTVINESMLAAKIIKESALNSYMATDAKNVIGRKSLSRVAEGDYIRSYNLLEKEHWYTDGHRIIVLPMDMDDRLGNLIKKGSLIDIKVLLNDIRAVPKTVLSKVKVEDILDESGMSVEYSAANKKVYAKLVLEEEQRNRIYAALKLGELSYELYCDDTQKPVLEEFAIPAEYMGTQDR